MKIASLAVAALFTFASVNSSFAQEKLKPGSKMPAATIAMKGVDGKKVDLKSAMGKNGLLVMFSCNTCPFVLRNQPVTLKTMQYAQKNNVGMVIVNSNEDKREGDDSFNEMVVYAKKQGYTVPYLVDEKSKVADEFGANHTPEVFLFDKNGVLVYKGAMNDNPSDPNAYKTMYVTDAIDAVVAGKKVDPATTKSIGCSIKRKG